jgi:hypothetical protein
MEFDQQSSHELLSIPSDGMVGPCPAPATVERKFDMNPCLD